MKSVKQVFLASLASYYSDPQYVNSDEAGAGESHAKGDLIVKLHLFFISQFVLCHPNVKTIWKKTEIA